jgi:hypothetical protein
MRARNVSFVALSLSVVVLLLMPAAEAAAPFIESFNHVHTIASTVPHNGDVNPYGVAVVPATNGKLTAGNILVSNFNDSANEQGTGTTIVQIGPSGGRHVFANITRGKLPGPCPGGVGLTTALVSLRSGFVVVGSLPTRNGTSRTAKAGCLIVLDDMGRAVETISGSPINGPWDMTASDGGTAATLFVTNVLNGTVAASPSTVRHGTIVRIAMTFPSGTKPVVGAKTVIGDGFGERTDPAALVVGPTGVGLASDGTLYVADSVGNQIVAIANAQTASGPSSGAVVSTGGNLSDPLGLTMAPNGDILTTNGNDGNLVETTPAGSQVSVKMLDTSPTPPGPNGAGTLFGLAVDPSHDGVYFVDDGTNTLEVLRQ